MGKKKVKAIVKIQMEAGKATPAPPVGTALGPHGVNIMEFVKTYNDRTASMAGQVIPVEITIFEDRSFIFVTKTPPAAALAAQVDPRRDHDLGGPQFYFCAQAPPRRCAVEEGGRRREGLGQAEQG